MLADINRKSIVAVERLIRPYVRRTPIIEINGADLGLGPAHLCLKLELLQCSGSFKVRGAFTNLTQRPVPRAGVVAASGGNHGAAVAYAAKKLRLPAKIFVPTISSPAKLARIRQYGADLVVTGALYADALEASEQWVAQSGGLAVHAYDQPETVLGQGTVGLELEQQYAGLDTLLVPIGGGGLIAGVAAWFGGNLKIVGVEPEQAPTMQRALAAGKPVDSEAGGIAADSLGPKRVGELTFAIAQRFVDHVVLVTDDAIREAQVKLWESLRIVAEPGGAAAFAALCSGGYESGARERIGVIVSGGNTVAVDFRR
jgi:threonine dehydratase